MDLSAIPPAAGFIATLLSTLMSMLAFLWYALAKDVIVTGPSHRRELAMKDEMLAMRKDTIDELKGALATKDKTIESLSGSVAKLTIVGDTAAHSLSDVARMAAETRCADDTDPGVQE